MTTLDQLLASTPEPVEEAPDLVLARPFDRARLIIWDEDDKYRDTDYIVDAVPLHLSAVQEAFRDNLLNENGEDPSGKNLAGFHLEVDLDDRWFQIPQEWVGKMISIEVAPSLIEEKRDDIDDICEEWDATPA